MIEYKRLEKDQITWLQKYFSDCPISFCDLSVGVRYLWCDEFIINYAVVDDTVIMKESYEGESDAFYFPMGKNVENALSVMERECIEKSIPLRFCCIDTPTKDYLASRYYDVTTESDPDWNDYIYLAKDFIEYKGKKFRTQRNHVNRFKKLYPEAMVSILKSEDIPDIERFLDEYLASTKKESTTFWGEEKNLVDYIRNFESLTQFGIVVRVGGKVIAFSIGERVNDTLIIHVEKGLKAYDGVYPFTASEFAKGFATDEVKYINREEDCGDLGLRYSKTQYNPVEIKDKWVVTAKSVFNRLSSPIKIQTERLTVEDISEGDKEDYFNLYIDDELNKLWGYDYRDDCKGEPTPNYFFNFQKSLKEKGEEYSFAVKKDGKMIGELVLHNFDFFGGVEMGFRFFKHCQGKGYATESGLALKDYVKKVLKATRLKSRCFKQNVASRNLILRLGLKDAYQDEERYFFGVDL